MSMANRYNSMPLPAEVMVDGASATIIRRRESYDDLTAHELAPEPLALPAATTTPATAGSGAGS
jgi:diaminopimelate decarboxylase